MNDKILYLECASGISGDMTVGALLDLGASVETVDRALRSMPLDGCKWEVTRGSSHGLAGCDFNVVLPHEHHHDYHEHHHEHVHRNLADVCEVIAGAEISANAADLAVRIFRIVAEAEATAHGVDIAEVHFHEVGALDSIADIVAAAVCIDDLGIKRTVVGPLTEGRGQVLCQHGMLPIPVPAVAAIAAAHALELNICEVNGEMVTPTGAAIAAALRTESRLPEKMRICRIGSGCGKRDFGRPNILRAMLLEEVEDAVERKDGKDSKLLLESNIDDCGGEALGLTLDLLLAAGANDVHFMPCFMKKNRPGWLLRVICDAALAAELEEIIFRNTTTIGIRRLTFDRTVMERRMIEVETQCGKVAVKRCSHRSVVRYYPEFESVRQAAERSGMDFAFCYAAAQQKAYDSEN